MHIVRLIVLQLFTFLAANASCTGYNGERVLEGTPEFVSCQYVDKLFKEYGVASQIPNEMGDELLSLIMTKLGLGIIHEIPAGQNVEEDHKVDENHRKKRSAQNFGDSVWPVPHNHKNISDTATNETDCLSAPLLIKQYHLDGKVTASTGITSYEFGLICPSLVYLSIVSSCITFKEDKEERPDGGSVWGYGFLSITIISLLSFLGVLIVPFMSKALFNSALCFLVAMAVGALCGDALLHLIPHSQSTSHGHSKDPIYKNLMVLFGIYILFVVEGLMKLFQNKKRKNKQKTDQTNHSQIGEEGIMSREAVSPVSVGNVNDQIETHEFIEGSTESHGGHSHHHNHGNIEDKGIASMAWMVIAGDGMHNFSDGVAIGAAFSLSIVGGLSTSIAVFCHELPHELGDFAMLLKAGMTVKQALFYNGFAATLGFLGLAVGILIGNYAETVTLWIFACTAGMFLYVALVDMLPEMSGTKSDSNGLSLSVFILQNIGLSIGVVIMYLISVYEESFDLATN